MGTLITHRKYHCRSEGRVRGVLVRVSVAAVAAGCRSTGAAWTQGLISTAAQVRARLGILRSVQDAGRAVTMQSSSEEKIRLFRAMFCGREDVLAEENGIEYVEDNEEHGSSTLAWKWFFHAPWKYPSERMCGNTAFLRLNPTVCRISILPRPLRGNSGRTISIFPPPIIR